MKLIKKTKKSKVKIVKPVLIHRDAGVVWNGNRAVNGGLLFSIPRVLRGTPIYYGQTAFQGVSPKDAFDLYWI